MSMDGASQPSRRPRGRSIRARVAALVVLATLGTGLAAGLAGVWATRRAVNHRYTDNAVRNAARLMGDLRLPRSPHLAKTLASIFGGAVAFVGEDGRRGADSFDEGTRSAFDDYLAARSRPARATLGGTVFHARSAALEGAGEIWLLIPEATLRQARWRVLLPLLGVCAVATLTSVLLGLRVTRAVVRPLVRLGDDLHGLAANLERGEWGMGEPRSPDMGGRQPAEVAILAQSFECLLGDLRQARQRLAESSRLAAVGKLAASVAHELRNPLAGIRMNAQVLAQEQAREGRADESLERIVRECDRLSVRLEELLGLATGSRTGAAARTPPERLSLASLRDAAVGLVGTQFRQAGIALRCTGDFAAEVEAGADDIRRILLNLLLNALEVSSEGDTVELRAGTLDDGRVRLAVADQGGGVPSEAGDVFAPFVTTKAAGVGLGLAISRELAERNDGELGFRNADGGAEFALVLPRAREENP